MDDQAMKDTLEAAMGPYLKAFVRFPNSARLEVTITEDGADGVFFCGPTDFVSITEDSTMRAHFSRAFNKLSLHLDDQRAPTLVYEKS